MIDIKFFIYLDLFILITIYPKYIFIFNYFPIFLLIFLKFITKYKQIISLINYTFNIFLLLNINIII